VVNLWFAREAEKDEMTLRHLQDNLAEESNREGIYVAMAGTVG
jgi:hypothetical protein